MRLRKATIVLLCLLFMSQVALGIDSALATYTPSSSIELEGKFKGTSASALLLTVRIKNISSTSVTIHWDSCSLVFPGGRSERIIHTGVRYVESAKPQAETTIPPGAYIEEAIWPANMSTYYKITGWTHDPIRIPSEGTQIKLYVSWTDKTGKHEGPWTWNVDRSGKVFWTIMFILLGIGLVSTAFQTE